MCAPGLVPCASLSLSLYVRYGGNGGVHDIILVHVCICVMSAGDVCIMPEWSCMCVRVWIVCERVLCVHVSSFSSTLYIRIHSLHPLARLVPACMHNQNFRVHQASSLYSCIYPHHAFTHFNEGVRAHGCLFLDKSTTLWLCFRLLLSPFHTHPNHDKLLLRLKHTNCSK
jgi:hypothetical protein